MAHRLSLIGWTAGLALGGLTGCGDRDRDVVYVNRGAPPVRVHREPVYVDRAPSRSVIVREAPPPVRIERRPRSPGRDYLWINGSWDYQRDRYVWRSGRYEKQRPGYRHVPSRWTRDRDGWRHDAERWERDRR